eukprot:4585421-Amphidinium_carterae.1
MEHLLGPCAYCLITGSGISPFLRRYFSEVREIHVVTTAVFIAVWISLTAASTTAKWPRWNGAKLPWLAWYTNSTLGVFVTGVSGATPVEAIAGCTVSGCLAVPCFAGLLGCFVAVRCLSLSTVCSPTGGLGRISSCCSIVEAVAAELSLVSQLALASASLAVDRVYMLHAVEVAVAAALFSLVTEALTRHHDHVLAVVALVLLETAVWVRQLAHLSHTRLSGPCAELVGCFAHVFVGVHEAANVTGVTLV